MRAYRTGSPSTKSCRDGESASPRNERTPSFLLLTYDSCRYDTLLAADTPLLDSFVHPIAAQAPANFTFPAHQALFVGQLPLVSEDIPYYNRFRKQLIGLTEVGEVKVAKESHLKVASQWNVVAGLRDAGYQTVGAGAMNWFRQSSLSFGFEQFAFTGTDAVSQIEYVLSQLDTSRPFFVFINFGETHAPYTYRGKRDQCPVDVRARRMRWPPREEGPAGSDSEAFAHQVEAVEFLDRQLPRLFSSLPAETVVIVCADHGECFGEDGYWGHGFNHPKVLEVPLAIFGLDGTLPP